MGAIFISYRRDDSQGFAGRLEDDLSEIFGDARVFRDREIPAGVDFATHLEARLSEAEVVLVVIGGDWLDAKNSAGERRLGLADDWVRREIERALARDVAVVPVLVGGAAMPWPDQLPSSLRPLAGRQAFSVSDQRWRENVDQLAEQLGRLSPALARHRRSAAAPRDLGAVLRDEIDAAREAYRDAPATSARGGLGRWLAGRLGKAFSLVIGLAVIYILIRALGDAQTNRMMDKVIATTIEQVMQLF